MMASSLPTPPDSAAHDDRRTYPRIEVALPAFLHVHGQRHAVQLLDLSLGGARLSGAVLCGIGTEVVLDCGTTGRAGVVRWRQGELMGICFDNELDPRELAVQIQRSKALVAWKTARHEPGTTG